MSDRFEEAQIELLSWVVLKEHYHLIAVPQEPETLPKAIQCLHADSSRDWNFEDRTPRRACWYQYWDTTLWTEGDIASRVNYIHRNPVKHGYVTSPEDWEWSSYRDFLETDQSESVGTALHTFPAPLRIPRDEF